MEITLTKENYSEVVEKSEKPVIIDFWATWCGPCKMISPFVEQVKEELEGKADVFKVDIDHNEGLCERFSVSAVPTLLFFKDGELADKIVGAVNKEMMEEKLKALM